jgi:CRISPR-associated protein Cas5d
MEDQQPPAAAGGKPPNPPRPLEVVVWGPMACFTRPEAKAERVSYPVPTPSAARGVCEAIFWKPEIRYRVREIHVLKSVRYASILRNEVTAKADARGFEPLDVMERRTQRHTLALLDVAYRLLVDVELRPGATADVAAYRDQFRRRVARGQCFHRPYLGCREFAADFGPREGDGSEDLPPDIAPLVRRGPVAGLTQELGLMLFDLAFVGPGGAGGANVPLFFEARLDEGVLRVPDHLYDSLDGIAGPPQVRKHATAGGRKEAS